MDLLHAIAFIAGLAISTWSCLSAIRAFMIPGSQHHLMGRIVFRAAQAVFLGIGSRLDPARRQSLYTLFGPLGLLGIYAMVMVLNLVGFALMFWAISGRDASLAGASAAIVDSGSALSTLGFADLSDLPRSLLSVLEALATTTVAALLIGYLPVIFSTYLATENAVDDLEAETGGARCGAEVLIAIQRNHNGDALWKAWSRWFAGVGKRHGSLVGNLFLRAPEAHTSWVAAAGSVLDAAALRQTVVAGPPDRAADYCLATGIEAARRSVRFLGFADEPAHPPAADALTRGQFDDACRRLREAGLTLDDDLDAAWTAFQQQRARYVRHLATLAAIKGSPLATLDCTPAAPQAPLALPIRRGTPMPAAPAAASRAAPRA